MAGGPSVIVAIVPSTVLIVALAILVPAEIAGTKSLIRWFKPVASASFVAVGVIGLVVGRTGTDGTAVAFGVVVVLGLLLSAAGDVFLIGADRPKVFTLGLVAFLLAHIAYSAAFVLVSRFAPTDILTAFPLALVVLFLYRRFGPNLGSMRGPVLAYMLVISFMVSRAAAVPRANAIAVLPAWLVAGGALAFYVSDVMLAWNRYASPFRLNRLSLVFYYGGQAAIAWSVVVVTTAA